MLDSVTPDDIVAEVYLIRTAFQGCVVITEGETDVLLFERFSNTSETKYLPAWGKYNVLEAIEIINSDGVTGVIAFVDSDFDRPLKRDAVIEGLFYIDHHDALVCLFLSNALDRILKEYSSTTKIEKFLKTNEGVSFRQLIVERLEGITKAKYLSVRDGLNIRFKEIDLSRHVDKKTLFIDLNRFDAALRNTNKDHRDINSFICQYKNEVLSNNHLAWEFVNGHDLATMLGVALRQAVSNERKEICDSENIEKLLRLSFERSDLTQTTFFQTISQWEEESGFIVFGGEANKTVVSTPFRAPRYTA
jgi:hypothetical protein